jgi:hypothetical protein
MSSARIPDLQTVSYTRHPKWDYTLTSDLPIITPWELGNHDFQDEFGNVWLETRGKLAIVKRGYAWDGASLAPDFKDVILASCAHDALLQFRDVPCFPLSKAQVDKIFRDLMPYRFAARWIYWGAVYLFGGAYSKLTGPGPRGSCGLTHRR